ncbi:MAG: DNA polymerase I [Dehalococcoidia bacterium]|nr:DNA polymerase I [Dehalococcoidia bacterium]
MTSQQSALDLQGRPLLILLDGHALVHRAWHAIQNPLTLRRTGEDVRGAYGVLTMVLKTLQDHPPFAIALTFDTPAPTFRHTEFAAYKAQRPPAPPELRGQFPHVRRILEAFRMPVYELDGYEADDLLGTLSAQAEAKGMDTLIVSGDMDTLQLVSPHVSVLLQHSIAKRVIYDERTARQRYGGLAPTQLPQIKALCGDPSDNIPGVPGIGEKTAIKLLGDFGSLEGLYANLEKLSPRQRETLQQHRAAVEQSARLATIRRDVPVQLNVQACRWGQFKRREVVELLREYEWHSVVDRIPQAEGDDEASPSRAQPAGTDYRTVTRTEELEALVSELAASQQVAFDTEATGTDPMRSRLVGLSFSTAQGRAWYVPVGHAQDGQLPKTQALDALRPILEDPGKPKTAHNANYDMTLLANEGVQVRGVECDTMLLAYLLGHRAIGLKQLTLALLGEEATPISALLSSGKNQKTMDQVPIVDASAYACSDADMTLRLRAALEPDLKKQRAWDLFTKVEMPLLPIVVQMQRDGVALDVSLLQGMGETLGEELARMERETYEAVGHQFNLGSPKQLAEVLFGELQLAKGKRTRTGGYTTDAATLEPLRGVHPVIEPLLRWRELSKLKSTYVDALPEMVNPATGRVHTSYNLAGAVTGRISSSEPNLQNIPIRTELGRRIRRAFVPGFPGWLLIAADYSQIELRVLAHLSQDPALLDAFHRGLDIHAATASQVFGAPLDKVTPDQRRLAKVLNFGVIYGLSAYGIAQQTELSPEEGTAFIESYFARYPGVREYLERTRQQARDVGSVETLLGRRRATPEASTGSFPARQAAEREAINMPVQGTAAEVMKLAMIRVARRLEEEKLRSRMLLQVHDELIFEAPSEEAEPLKALLLDVMPRAMEGFAEFSVPLAVAVKSGANWGELE